ncbi:MAG: hypothetical protein Q8R82_06525 [Hyphomonadaceae bacterium]|nr:hypothetical protein [Hyphomonadaceae bacterium]
MLKTFRVVAATAFMAASAGVSPIVHAQPTTPDFGDDKSRWAKDGECDDRRFTGAGMSDAPFIDSDIGHDASDCRSAWRTGKIQLAAAASRIAATPDFGDDASDWSEDGECDDPRFKGDGMTTTTLLEDDILHDAADCSAAWQRGEISLAGFSSTGVPDFGDDDGAYALDGECDDPRFKGAGMTDTTLLSEDILHDATDCEDAWSRDQIELR